jgi:acyl carrier protein
MTATYSWSRSAPEPPGSLFVVHKVNVMKEEDIIVRLKSVFEKVLEANDITITRELTARDIEKWDSLRHLQLINEVEKTFGLKFKLREVLGMKNMGDLIDLIHVKHT